MSLADRVSGLFWFIFSLLIAYESYQLGLGVLHQPGPGFLFFWTSIVLGILSLTIIVRSRKDKKPSQSIEPVFPKTNLAKSGLVLIALFLYAFFMEELGFMTITFLLFIFLVGFVERKKWSFTLLASLAVTGATYLIFDIGLKSQLPRGILDFFRF